MSKEKELKIIGKKRLQVSSPETVYEYLKKHGGLVEEVEKCLLDRNNDLINLGLAQFSYHSDIFFKLFLESNDEAIRCAALSNRHFLLFSTDEEEEELRNILHNGTENEVAAMLMNEACLPYRLKDFFYRTDWAKGLSDERWRICGCYALQNPNLMGEFKHLEDYEYSLAIEAAWNLLKNAPLTSDWAFTLLCYFAGKGLPDFFQEESIIVPYGLDDDFFKHVFARWSSQDNESEEKFKKLRWTIASRVPTDKEKLHEWMADHDDLSIRTGHYVSFYPKDIAEIKRYYERDKKDFIQNALYNYNLYKKEEIRDCFRTIIEKTKSYEDLNKFESMYERIGEKYPHLLPRYEREELELQKPVTKGMLDQRLNELEENIGESIKKLESNFTGTQNVVLKAVLYCAFMITVLLILLRAC